MTCDVAMDGREAYDRQFYALLYQNNTWGRIQTGCGALLKNRFLNLIIVKIISLNYKENVIIMAFSFAIL